MSHSGLLATSRNMEHRQRLRSDYTCKLEVESQQMEDRLKMIKTMMAAEKARRVAEGGIHWKSGQTTQPSKKYSMRDSGRPIRVRLLTEKDSKGRTKASSSNYNPCGQCNKTLASLSCIECAENYCQVCFIKFHQKGALAKHRVKPYISEAAKQGSKKTINTENNLQQSNPSSDVRRSQLPNSKQANSTEVDTQGDANTSLLDGTYDEAASAALFQQALAEWRNGGSVGLEKKEICSRGGSTQQMKALTAGSTVMTSSAGTNTNSLTKERKQVEVSFSGNSGVSYFEKIITRRNRYDPTLLRKMGMKSETNPDPQTAANSETESQIHETIEQELTPTQYNVFYSPEDIQYDQCPSFDDNCEEYGMYRPLSSVQIEEIGVTKCSSNGKHTISSKESQDELVSKRQETRVTKKHVSQSDKRKTRGPKETSKQNRIVSSKKTKPCEKVASQDQKLNSNHPKTRENRRLYSKSLTGTVPTPKLDIDMQASVKNAWSGCGRSSQRYVESQSNTAQKLSQFFLHGVEHTQTPKFQETNEEVKERDPTPQADTQLQFAASIWLPDNSIAPDDSEPSSITPTMDDIPGSYYPQDSDSDLELEPHNIGHKHSSSDPVTYSKSKLTELEVMVDTNELAAERNEWDQEDNDALEDLAWELASTIESEGRLSRCDTELDNIEDSYEHKSVMDGSATDLEDKSCEIEIDNVNMERVLSEFELYQKQLMDEDM